MTSNPNHAYLAGEEASGYSMELWGAMGVLAPFLTKKQLRAIESDLQLNRSDFDEAKYLQAACETAISSTMGRLFPDAFVYERKIKPPKDVDCSFEKDGFRFNFEIKCPDYSRQHKIDQTHAFKVGAFGRMDDYQSLVEKLQREVFNAEGNPNADPDKPLILQQHMDNKLKDFLLSAHGKFADNSSEKELNVLVVCCSDRMSMQEWFFYMFGSQGLLTQDSYHPPEQYDNVDSVILTNIYHRHHDYKNKGKLSDHWDWSKSFNLIFSNPLRKKDKMEASWKLVDLIPNHSLEVTSFEVKNGVEEMRIVHFIVEELLSKGLYYFQPDI
ncbi:hypothetical protein ACTXKF_18870 [Vreelandella alkaliphila]|uniref:hypothetical protein n=1 Tax=Halomonadaceae TaxID=28256 RepID=UPI000E86FAAF|nr:MULTISPECIES: hypothetical protein [unclassified Halomonas]HBS81986.1 hypothetical protein [Halomonas campaniensis]